MFIVIGHVGQVSQQYHGTESKAPYMPGEHSTTELQPQTFCILRQGLAIARLIVNLQSFCLKLPEQLRLLLCAILLAYLDDCNTFAMFLSAAGRLKQSVVYVCDCHIEKLFINFISEKTDKDRDQIHLYHQQYKLPKGQSCMYHTGRFEPVGACTRQLVAKKILELESTLKSLNGWISGL